MIRKDGNKAYGFVCNLSNKDEIYSVAKAVKTQVGDISILINNAGIVSGTSILDTPDGKFCRFTFHISRKGLVRNDTFTELFTFYITIRKDRKNL